MLPCRQLRDKYCVERQDVYSPGGEGTAAGLRRCRECCTGGRPAAGTSTELCGGLLLGRVCHCGLVTLLLLPLLPPAAAAAGEGESSDEDDEDLGRGGGGSKTDGGNDGGNPRGSGGRGGGFKIPGIDSERASPFVFLVKGMLLVQESTVVSSVAADSWAACCSR